MKNFKLFAISALFFCYTQAKSQSYTQLSPGDQIAGKQAYILPKASFVIEIPIESTILSCKKYNSTYEKYFKVLEKRYGLDPKKYKSLKSDSTKTNISIGEDSIKFKMISTPDYEKVFYVASTSGWNKNQAVTFTYGVDGILTDGEASRENKTFDILMKGISSIVGIVRNFEKGTDNEKAIAQDTLNLKELDDALADFDKLQFVNNFDVYKALKTTYEKRYNYLFAEKFYSEKKKLSIIKVVYTPKKETLANKNIPFFNLDKKTGKISFEKTLGRELWGKDIDTVKLDGTEVYQLKFKPVQEQQSKHFKNRSSKEFGFAFNIPLKVELQLLNPKGQIIVNEITKVPQLGIIGYINNIKRAKLSYSLDPLTGELKKLSVEGKAILVDQIGSTAATITDATNLIKGDDADTRLENEVKRLENEKKKRDLLKELGEN